MIITCHRVPTVTPGFSQAQIGYMPGEGFTVQYIEGDNHDWDHADIDYDHIPSLYELVRLMVGTIDWDKTPTKVLRALADEAFEPVSTKAYQVLAKAFK